MFYSRDGATETVKFPHTQLTSYWGHDGNRRGLRRPPNPVDCHNSEDVGDATVYLECVVRFVDCFVPLSSTIRLKITRLSQKMWTNKIIDQAHKNANVEMNSRSHDATARAH